MKVSRGIQENKIIAGNVYDKYGSNNPIVRWLMKRFVESVSRMVDQAAPQTIHEVGCGEGYWVLTWTRLGIKAHGSDFSEKVIELARENAKNQGIFNSLFTTRSIYDIEPGRDSADLIVCCEVLEHLENPEAALSALKNAATQYVILSVPREPLWCLLNLARGKYFSSLGNTPGHIQHWSKSKFIDLVSRYFSIISISNPIPWTILLCDVRR